MPNFNEIKTNEVSSIKFIEVNGVQFNVVQYLPFTRKLELISEIINASGDDQGFYNSAKLNFYIDMKMMEYYTDLTFNEDTDAIEVYDNLVVLGFFTKMYEAIPEGEFQFIVDNVMKTINNIYKYRNSVYGILDALKTDYSDMNLDVEEITKKLANGENVEFLKEVMDKMG